MSLMIDIVKYVIIGIVLVVFIAKTWQVTTRIVKKFKGKKTDDFQEDLYG